MKTEEKINEFIANQQKALADFKSELLKELNPKFEVGKWCKGDGHSLINHKSLNLNNSGESFGFDASGNWYEKCYFNAICDNVRPATESEVKEALIKEAEKRGFNKDAVWNSIIYDGKKTNCNDFGTSSLAIEFKYDSFNDSLTLGYGVCYKQGKWATIVKDEAIKIDKYECEFGEGVVKIGCKKITKEQLFHLKTFMRNNDLGSVTFLDCPSVNLTTINAILEKLK